MVIIWDRPKRKETKRATYVGHLPKLLYLFLRDGLVLVGDHEVQLLVQLGLLLRVRRQLVQDGASRRGRLQTAVGVSHSKTSHGVGASTLIIKECDVTFKRT